MLTESSRYDEVRSLYINQLACAWMEDSTTESIRASVKEKVNSFAQGNLKHAGEALSALWEIVNKDEDIKASSNTSPAVSSFLFFPPKSYRGAYFTSPDRAGHEPG